MNHASEHDIDRVLTALRDTEPSAGLEARILQSLENRNPARSAWFRSIPLIHWATAAITTAAILAVLTLAAHRTPHPTPTVAQTSGDPSLPDASSPPKVGPHNPPSSPIQNPVISTGEQPSPSVISTAVQPSSVISTGAQRGGEIAAFTEAGIAHALSRRRSDRTAAYPPHEFLCDCDRLALEEMQAPSHPAPEMPLTAQERLLLRVVYHREPVEIAQLEPFPNNVPRPPAGATEDAAVKTVVQTFLKQLAAAEALNPTPPPPEPTPAFDPDANDPVPSVESASSPN